MRKLILVAAVDDYEVKTLTRPRWFTVNLTPDGFGSAMRVAKELVAESSGKIAVATFTSIIFSIWAMAAEETAKVIADAFGVSVERHVVTQCTPENFLEFVRSKSEEDTLIVVSHTSGGYLHAFEKHLCRVAKQQKSPDEASLLVMDTDLLLHANISLPPTASMAW